MKIILLTRGESALIDDEDYDRVNQFRWNFNGYYAVRSAGYYKKRDNIFMHRFIMNTPRDFFTDHVNGNKLDNRKENLRICSKSDNCRYVNKRISNKSGYKGVCFHKASKKWGSCLTYKGKQVWIGVFSDKEKAAKAYDNMSKKLFGDFALLNFPLHHLV